MTQAQIEERLTALEEAVAQLRAQQSGANGAAPLPAEETVSPDDDIIPGVEYVVVLNKPPTKTIRLQGVIREIRPARQDLGISDADLASLIQEEGHE